LRDGVDFQCNPVLEDPKRLGASRKDEIAYNQLRLGSTQFVNGRFRWGCRWGAHNGREICGECNVDMSPEHFLFECSRFAPQRERFREDFEKEMEARKMGRPNLTSPATDDSSHAAVDWVNSEMGFDPPEWLGGNGVEHSCKSDAEVWDDDFYASAHQAGEKKSDESRDWCDWGSLAVLGCYPEGVILFLRDADLWVDHI